MDGGGDGYLTHTDHSLTSAERAGVQVAMNGYLKTQASLSGLRTSYRLSDSMVAVCGYVSAVVKGMQSPPAIFAGTFAGPGSTNFVPLRVPGKGQDPQRIATVRAFCHAEQIDI